MTALTIIITVITIAAAGLLYWLGVLAFREALHPLDKPLPGIGDLSEEQAHKAAYWWPVLMWKIWRQG